MNVVLSMVTSLQNLERQLILTTVRGNDVCSRQKHPDELGERHRKSGRKRDIQRRSFPCDPSAPIRQAALGAQEKDWKHVFSVQGADETNSSTVHTRSRPAWWFEWENVIAGWSVASTAASYPAALPPIARSFGRRSARCHGVLPK
ncbi:hypothetical protein HB777_12635 [Mesorhizobium loti]|nr:hypothetical protein HB777_12635 [Mesorhizobium loti]